MTEETNGSDRKSSVAYLALLAKAPPSVRDQIKEHRRTREPERRKLMQHLNDYDKSTRQGESEILQIYEMSLQSRPRSWSLRDKEPER